MTEREAIEWLKGCVVSYEVDNKGKPNGNITCDLTQEVLDMAISALEKQEQTNTQSVNSTHRSCPNTLESLNILEQAKDDKGNVPMSLVRQAFRNILEQDKWISCKERLPEEYGEYRITWKESGSDKTFIADSEFEPSLEWDDKHDRFKGEWLLDDYIKAYPDVEVIAWKPIEEPYTEEENDKP